MAVDQTEAMIAAIKAQLEKERAAEAAKQKIEAAGGKAEVI